MGRTLANLLATIFSGERAPEVTRRLEEVKSSSPSYVDLDARLGAGRLTIV